MNIHERIRKVSDTNTYATEAGIIVHKAQTCVSFNSHFIQVRWVVRALDHFYHNLKFEITENMAQTVDRFLYKGKKKKKLF